MQADFWLQRWRERRTAWHRESVMPLLVEHWPRLEVPAGTRVLVPLCGKSLDMLWLAAQGLRVLGVELSPLAIEQFFAENDLVSQKRETADGVHHTAGNIEIIQGDLFKTDAATLSECRAVYDRAALIALPAPDRRHYAEKIYARLPAGCRGLMITFEYPQAEMNGPPFSVDEAEIHRLFDPDWEVALAERRDILAGQPGFREAGLTALNTTVYRFHRR
ncbi:MAG: thiopurine S-methyltransferase [Gammaproteobacteria bacterium]